MAATFVLHGWWRTP
ncbi:trp operon leader peptide [Salmonella enterica]|uniref:trp operon leader peptide n=8 Tax=Salmonella enterica TaxID=28901 RepID=A0A402NWN4_SALER|nr:trp operon leader peptide [Salmonella enterica]ASO63646.1 hypothetical protein LFZ50_23125 [Salmonella enterica subsp. arizonae serovar 53:-:- str. SA20100345]AXC79268.1 trp operon leader peptide [Salmonella enterica subsp. arizonae serovar 63:g,z51:-]EAN8393842.1 trp operon leader peptide [Salmonella enterica subsp. arizonae serovar 13,23:gz51:-]EAN8611511.1 trp operon leader peptide [Salmonella enterica subsp. arizonae serovar 48:z4,z24:-]EAO5937043.1 trp operon leader peptide [Salmonella